jgi:hypothetical protein
MIASELVEDELDAKTRHSNLLERRMCVMQEGTILSRRLGIMSKNGGIWRHDGTIPFVGDYAMPTTKRYTVPATELSPKGTACFLCQIRAAIFRKEQLCVKCHQKMIDYISYGTN